MSELNYTKKLEAKIEELQTEIDSRGNNIEAVEEENQELRGKIEELEREIDSLKEDVRLEQGEKSDLDDEIVRLENKIEDLEDKLDELYSLEKIEFELNRLDSYWRDRFVNRFTDEDLSFMKEKIINIFLYG